MDATLEQLRRAADRCRGCDLYKNATQAVFGEIAGGGFGGSSGAAALRPLMLVGEQPGDQEDVQGHPFVGPAGRVLDRALADARIDRSRVYLTNAVKHFKWTPRGKRRLHSKPSAREVHACRPWLEREIEIVRPSAIVCLGATAGLALFGPSFRVGAMRGREIRDGAAEFAAGIPLFATVHPSSILRLPERADREREYRAFVADLRLAAGRRTHAE
jgi:DNA polymerase